MNANSLSNRMQCRNSILQLNIKVSLLHWGSRIRLPQLAKVTIRGREKMSDKESKQKGWWGVLIWLCITGIIYSAILAIKYGTIEPEITPEVEAFKDKAATIAVIIPLAFCLILWLISLIITQLDKQKLATLTKELELQSSERERIEDKMNSLLRKLEE